MLDKTLIDIISTTIGAAGLIGAITKYDFPKSKKTVYGENLIRRKEEFINNSVAWYFTAFAMVGIFFQVIFNSILADIIPDRLYSQNFYFLALIVSAGLVTPLVLLIKALSKWAVKNLWKREISHKAKDSFHLAKQAIMDSQDQSKTETMIKIINLLEELFEEKSPKSDLKSRLEYFEKYFQ